MPLFEKGIELIRTQLQEIQKGNRVRAMSIGVLTDVQLCTINAERHREHQPPIVHEILFLGTHLFRSRVVGDGYTIDDVIDQIASSLSEIAVVVVSPKMTVMQNYTFRTDRYGNRSIRDMAVFECTARHPRPELYSVIPKGDIRKPNGRSG
jgi:hypothetical protein